MPVPSPKETKEHFMQRCIPMRHSEHPDEDNKQSVAVCFSIWREHHKKGQASESQATEEAKKKKKSKMWSTK